MENLTAAITFVLSAGTVALLAASAALLYALLSKGEFAAKALSLSERYGLEAGFAVALLSVAGSLAYSNVVGFPPCELCWIQRIFIYPQAVIFGIGLWKRDRGAALYGLVLSVLGGLVALYHSYTQLGGGSFLPCTAEGGDCARVYFVEWGFITIPTMSFAAFLMLALVSVTVMRGKTQQ